jgi:acyl-CoA thioesterase
MTTLEESLVLTPLGTGEWRANADPRYEANSGMFGGWTAAILLKSVQADARAQGTPSALTVHYVKQVPPRSELHMRTRLVGGSRSLAYWTAELSIAGQDEVAALATVLLAQRRPSDSFTESTAPSVVAPDGLPPFHPPATFGQQTLMRAPRGYPPFNLGSTESVAWTRELSGRPLDHLQLVYLADTSAPRIFYKSPGPRLSSTVTMSVYFLASEAELSEIGDDDVLVEAVGTRAEQSTFGMQARLWSRTGSLLATTEQLCWFK